MGRGKKQDWTPIKMVTEGGVQSPPYSPEREHIEQVDREILNSLPPNTKRKLTRTDPDLLTLRQRQRVGAEWLAEVLTHPLMRQRILEEGLKDPITLLKIASQERPKELHIEQDVNHNVVVVPARMDEKEWNAAVDAEIVKSEEGWNE